MDTLSSSSLATFQVPKPTKPNHQPHLKPPVPHHPYTTARTTTSSSLAALHQKDKFTPLNSYHPKQASSTLLRPLSRTSSPPRASVLRRAASGYAAALLDLSQCNGTVLKVERDVRRLLRVLRNEEIREFMMDEMVQEDQKGQVVKKLLEKGKFEKSFVGLVKLVVDKGRKVELVKEVLEEFLRVFAQLSGAINRAYPQRLAMGTNN